MSEQEYREALVLFDWHFNFSDDHVVWGNGNNQLARLHRMQRDIDPAGLIWREYMPKGIGIPGPIVAVAK